MIEINWSDVWQTLDSLKNYFIALGIIAAACVIAMIACARRPKPEKFLVRAHGGMLILVSLILVVNIICTGPMYTLLSLASGNGSLSQETSDASLALAGQISDEGIVLLQNDQNLLPLTGSDNINVFGWASTNPVYGGTGSGSLNDAYHTVSMLEGLANAGFQTNTELSDFYTAYRADRPAVEMWAQEWTLPEPPANTYSADLMDSAKSFSDTALIVFSRPGGEHIDLPKDLSAMDETAYKQNSTDYEDFPAGHHYLELSRSERDLVELVCSNFDNVVVIYNGAISFDVTVTNTGSVAGKDVVQVYYNPPYTNGGIEKASANLVAFDKTGELAPGASQTLTISFNVEDMASYDMSGNGRYVLEGGDYIISINSDSHKIIDSQTYTVSADVDYSAGRSTDLTAPANLFDFAGGGLIYLSRADGFANFTQATAAPATSLRAEDKALFVNNSNYQIPVDAGAEMPTTGAANGMKAVELRGAAFDDERWDTLLDNLTLDEMNNMIALGGYQTAPAASIDKVATTDCDGPAALNNNFTGVGSVGFPSSVMIACTWNEDLARAFGEGIADMAGDMDVSGWYAPAMNIHRTPFAGRNFEYYSEDGFLSGRIASQAAQGASDNGVYPYIYVAVNSRGYAPENLNVGGLMSWQIILIVVDVLLTAAVIALEVVIFKAYQKKAAAVK